ncbi:hypothetical protein ZIOFF_056090 [Zingiber officinale]|uniref:Acyl-CoA oxidase C-alpha1 domain-containing protein n=1 Tax=Zingiber officinale TaxID=94328 RepID=A0A8J5KQB7_ZINOF|nr:hypothetical protein ZIOFF_056090 [Zingiber officinale]
MLIIIHFSDVVEEEASVFRIFIDEPGYGDLHWKKWLPLAYKMQIIGYYARTELGHGSNVQGLETTATFDPKTDEFVIHSPTLTSSFVVQLRSLDDHSPLLGIVVGDIGMKFGNGAYNTMDNGVLQFDHVCIPRNQMLVRVSQVTREGKYVQSDVPRQFGSQDGSSKTQVQYQCVRAVINSYLTFLSQVIDYKTQQSRLFPLLASAYAFRFVGQWLKWLYNDVTERLRANDFSTLPEAHACTAGLKSLTTSMTTTR